MPTFLNFHERQGVMTDILVLTHKKDRAFQEIYSYNSLAYRVGQEGGNRVIVKSII